jgi:peroxiredoxin
LSGSYAAASALQREYVGTLTITIAYQAVLEDAATAAAEHDLDHVLIDDDGLVADTYGVSGTPAAVLVERDGSIATWGAGGERAIEELVEQALMPPPAAPGDPLPDLGARMLGGEEIRLRAFVGRETLFVFWNPSCGHCRQMHADLRRFEPEHTVGDTRLVIVSSGDTKTTSDEHFASLVVLDEGFTVGRAVGVPGTPSALLIDRQGRISADVVAGAEAIFALARRAPERLEVGYAGT